MEEGRRVRRKADGGGRRRSGEESEPERVAGRRDGRSLREGPRDWGREAIDATKGKEEDRTEGCAQLRPRNARRVAVVANWMRRNEKVNTGLG